ncbi:MAG: aldose 1-epimerase family protein [Eubacteriales bacterium]|nr:aldose 1-epimerase family protein [Eubacteriales bacterium]
MSLITIRNDQLTVVLSTMGAEIQSIIDTNGVERLWQGNPEIWSGRAPVLFPVAGGFRNDGYELDGKWYAMPKHGFAKLVEWKVEKAEAASATMLLTEKHPGFPFNYEFRIHFTLEKNSLKVDYDVKNTGDRTLWYSVGAHEAYQTPGDIEDYELVFDQEEALERYPLIGNLIGHETETMAKNTKVLPLAEKMLDHDAIVFRNLKSTGVTLQSRAHDRKVRVEFAGNPTLMFWHKPEAKYLCIEPWNNSPDFVDAELDITKKPNFISLKPGESQSRIHTIVIL